MHYFKAIGELKLELQSGNARFRSKLTIFCVTLKFDENYRARLLYSIKLCVLFHHHIYVNLNCSFVAETAKLGCYLCDLDLWHLNLTFCMDITSVSGDHSWWYDDGNIVKKVWQTDGRTEPFIELLGHSAPYIVTHPYQDNHRRDSSPAGEPIDVWSESHHYFNVSWEPTPT